MVQGKEDKEQRQCADRIPVMKTPELKGIRILAGLNDDELDALGKQGKIIGFPPGQVLFKQGQPADAMYFIIEGKVGAYTIAQGGGEVHLKTIEDGGHFGEIGLLQHGTRTANVRTVTHCTLFRLDREAFEGILKAPELAVPLLHSLSRSLAIRLAAITSQFTELKSFKNEWAV
jgi:CRP-like cAMP-binding protein